VIEFGALRSLLERPLSDVLVGGYFEAELEVPRFVARYESVYLNFSEKYLRISRLRSDRALYVETVNQVTADFEVEEGDIFGTASLWKEAVTSPFSDQLVQTIETYGDPREGTVHLSIEIVPEGGSDPEFLWFDGTGYSGIRLRALPVPPTFLPSSYKREVAFRRSR